MANRAGKLAKRYARALMQAVIKGASGGGATGLAEQVSAEQVSGGLSELAHLWENDLALAKAAQNPMFDKAERQQALVEIAKRQGLSEVAIRFLRVCFERDRISLLPEIASAFSELADQAAGILRVSIVTARGVSPDESRIIEQNLSSKLGSKVKFTWSVEPSLLGGLTVRYAGKVLDGSLSGRLERLERRLVA